MSEHNPKLYFQVALLALLLPLASGEFRTIYNLLRGQVSPDQTTGVCTNVIFVVIVHRLKGNR